MYWLVKIWLAQTINAMGQNRATRCYAMPDDEIQHHSCDGAPSKEANLSLTISAHTQVFYELVRSFLECMFKLMRQLERMQSANSLQLEAINSCFGERIINGAGLFRPNGALYGRSRDGR